MVSFLCFREITGEEKGKISMKRFKRGLAILLSTCMIGGMMPITTSAQESVSGNTVQTEDTAISAIQALMGMEGAEQPMAITLAQDSNGFYQINSAEDLQAFASLVNSGTKDAKAILTQDIDCSGLSDFTPIGTQANPFAGTFNGNSHAIKNLTINTPNADYVCWFIWIYQEGERCKHGRSVQHWHRRWKFHRKKLCGVCLWIWK